ncbi:MAG: DUF4203 domain-containing protein [Candidatus Promineifilaceae bacterium]
MTFTLLCMALIALVFGLMVVFGGYRLFLILLPIWGFFGGFLVGSQAIYFIFGDAFLGTITGWVVGFFVGLLFAVLSYLFYLVAVAVISFTAGYAATIAVLQWLFNFDDAGFVAWLIGVVVGVVLAFVVIRFNWQKYAIIIITAFGGTAAIIYTLLATFYGVSVISLIGNPVALAVDNSWLWFIFFVVVAGTGIYFQIVANRSFEVETYNRVADENWSYMP